MQIDSKKINQKIKDPQLIVRKCKGPKFLKAVEKWEKFNRISDKEYQKMLNPFSSISKGDAQDVSVAFGTGWEVAT